VPTELTARTSFSTYDRQRLTSMVERTSALLGLPTPNVGGDPTLLLAALENRIDLLSRSKAA
jgi:hypothetical protein